MPNEWIVDVLADLKAYAKKCGLDATAAQIEDASLIALAELSSSRSCRRVGQTALADVDDRKTGNVTQLFARSGIA